MSDHLPSAIANELTDVGTPAVSTPTIAALVDRGILMALGDL